MCCNENAEEERAAAALLAGYSRRRARGLLTQKGCKKLRRREEIVGTGQRRGSFHGAGDPRNVFLKRGINFGAVVYGRNCGACVRTLGRKFARK